MKIVSIVGARPNFMKIAPIADAISEYNRGRSRGPEIRNILVHTGQHYDEKMSDLFFRELEIPEPDINLDVGSGSHAWQTAEIMKRFEPVLLEHRPDYVLVVGDVNSTIACALVASKLGVKVIHVEAGLRSFDRMMPEEINRILTDAVSDLLFTSERGAEGNLRREGVDSGKIHFVGNVMIDTLLKHREKADRSGILEKLRFREKAGDAVTPYALVTLHRPSNVDDPVTLRTVIGALSEISRTLPVIFPIHPRTRNRIGTSQIVLSGNILLMEPLGYLDFLSLIAHARLVLTDSGGVQEETTVLGIPCLTLRENTERPATVTQGTNILVGTDREKIVSEALFAVGGGRTKEARIPEKWDGRAAVRIVDILSRTCDG